MFAVDDTIVALATPPGRGAIGVVRLSGPRAQEIASSLTRGAVLAPRVAHFKTVRVVDVLGRETADEAIVTSFPGPRSYTGDDVVEVSTHGNPLILDGVVRAALQAGARLAQPGEFTLRAFLNGKRDLVQAEAVADLIAAATPSQARAAADQLDGTLTGKVTGIDAELFDLLARLEASLDFPEEGYHFINRADVVQRIETIAGRVDALLADAAQGRMIREGATVVIVGRPNVGKSSLFNALLGVDRAIVNEVAGTTRDLVSERTDIEGVPITLVDTAGARLTHDTVEREGVARSLQARQAADLVMVVVDQSDLGEDDTQLLASTQSLKRVVVRNKADRTEGTQWCQGEGEAVSVSAKTGLGLSHLRRAIAAALTGAESLRDSPALTNVRHAALLADARGALGRAADAAGAGASEEFVVADLHAARACFDEVVGRRTSEDVLRHIFERFCIGK